MNFSVQELLNIFTAFVYSWLPALLCLWVLISLKLNTPKKKVLLGFVIGAILSSLAGKLNHFNSSYFSLNSESPKFFLLVGLVEELIKFISSYIPLFAINKNNWKQDLRINWLAISLSGALGFAAAENFIYGIQGQGSIARIIPMFAHCFFAILWAIFFYRASFCENSKSKILYITVGLIQGILLHALYNCIVSENIIPDSWKTLLSLSGIMVLVLVFSFYFNKLKALEEKHGIYELNSYNQSVNQSEKESFEKSFVLFLLSLFFPGTGHILKKEYFAGWIFCTLSFMAPYIVLRFLLTFIAEKLLFGGSEQSLRYLIISILTCLFVYLGIGFWSAWELKQKNKDLVNDDKKRRFTTLFPISALFLFSLLASFFLPVKQKGSESENKNKESIIKEIPLGISWEVEKVAPSVHKENNTKVGTKDTVNSLSFSSEQNKKISEKAKKEIKNESQDKLSTGVQNSDSNNPENLPSKQPQIGFIGVQLADTVLSQRIRSFIVFVYPNTSAERAGLKAGDFIVSVDGKNVDGLSAVEVSNLVRGQLGTSVDLVVNREGEGEILIKAFRTGALFQQPI